MAAALEEAANLPRLRQPSPRPSCRARASSHALGAPEDRQRRTIAAAPGPTWTRARCAVPERSCTRPLAEKPGRRAEALALLSDVESRSSSTWWRAIELRGDALHAAAGLTPLQAEIHLWLGSAVRATEGAGSRGRARGGRARARRGPRRRRSTVSSAVRVATGRFRRRPTRMPRELVAASPRARRAAVESRAGPPRDCFAVCPDPLVWSGPARQARVLLEVLRPRVERAQRAQVAAVPLWWRGMIELRSATPSRGRLRGAPTELSHEYTIDGTRSAPNDAW